jgi:hypothetical protein
VGFNASHGHSLQNRPLRGRVHRVIGDEPNGYLWPLRNQTKRINQVLVAKECHGHIHLPTCSLQGIQNQPKRITFWRECNLGLLVLDGLRSKSAWHAE